MLLAVPAKLIKSIFWEYCSINNNVRCLIAVLIELLIVMMAFIFYGVLGGVRMLPSIVDPADEKARRWGKSESARYSHPGGSTKLTDFLGQNEL